MGWERMVRTPDEVEAVVGRVPDESTRGKLRSAIQKLNERGFVFWWDRDNAEGWLRHALTLVTEDAERAIHALPYAQQVAKVVEAWQALGNVYRALDLPYSSDPTLRAVLDRDHDGSESFASGAEHKAWVERVRAHVFRDDDGTYAAVNIHHRLAFRADNTVDVRYLHANEASTEYWTHHHFYRADGSPDWRSYAFHHGVSRDPRGGREDTLFPALHWYYLQAREVLQKIASQGLFTTAILGRRYALLSNLRVAIALGIYRPTTEDRDGVSGLVGRAEYDAEEARSRAPETVTDGLDALGQGVGIIAAVPGGQMVGGFLGVGVRVMQTLVSAFESAGNIAAQRLVDRFGRRGVIVEEPLSRAQRQAYGVGAPETLPVVRTFEAGSLTGTASLEEGMPVHALATPPAPRTRNNAIFELAQTETQTAFTGTDEAGSRAGRAKTRATTTANTALQELVETETQPALVNTESHAGEHVVRADFYQDSLVWRGRVLASQARPDEAPPGGGSGRSQEAPSSGRGWIVAGAVGAVAALVALVASRRR